MPFIPPMIGAAMIGGGASIGSSLLGAKLSKANPTPAEQNVLNLQAQGMRQGQGLANAIAPQGQSLIGMGSAGYQPVLNYWSSLLSGNRGQMTSAMAPEIQRIGEGYQTAGQTSAALMPRGGPSASFLSELPFQQQRDVSSLLQTARPAAAQGLFQTAQGATGAGGGILGQAVNAMYGSTAAGRDILQQQQNMRQLEQQRGQSVGAGLFDMFQKYGEPALAGILNRGAGGTIQNTKGSTGTIFNTGTRNA